MVMGNDGETYLYDLHEHLSSFVLVGMATVLIFVAVVRFYSGYQKRQQKQKFLKEFDGPPADWFVGHARHFTMDEAYITTVRQWINDYGGIFRLNLFGQDLICLAEPDSLAAIMKTPGPKEEAIYSLISQWIGQGLITTNGPRWFRNRKLFTTAFCSEILASYTDVFDKTVTDVIEKWKTECNGKETCFEMYEIFSPLILENLLQTAFSYDFGDQRLSWGHSYTKANSTLNQATTARINSLILRFDFIFYNLTSQGKETKKALRVLKKFNRDVLNQRKEIKKQNEHTRKGKYHDFVDVILDAKDKDGCGLSDDEIMAEVDTFMFGGHDSTAAGLSWFMYNMATHPEHQERCRTEINEVLAGRDTITWSDLPNLEYLTMCIKESLRLHSPVPSVFRTLAKDLKLLDGRIIPSGTNVNLLLTGMHRNPAVWENPDEFDPYRFSPGNINGRHSHAFVPFSAGPRNCIGQHFALHDMKIVTSQVLKNFKINIDPRRPGERVFNLILRAKNGLWLKLKPL